MWSILDEGPLILTYFHDLFRVYGFKGGHLRYRYGAYWSPFYVDLLPLAFDLNCLNIIVSMAYAGYRGGKKNFFSRFQ